MGTQAVSPYQQVIEKTKGLAFRSQMLAMNIEKKLGIRTGDVSLVYLDTAVSRDLTLEIKFF